MMKKITLLLMALIIFPLTGVGYADLNDGLVAYYAFNGNTFDTSGNGHHGILKPSENGPELTTDKDGNPASAYYFDGADDWIDIDEDFDLPNTFSIAMWVNPDNPLGGNQHILSKHDSDGENIFVFGIHENKHAVWILTSGHEWATPTSGWQHLAVVVKEDSGKSNVTLYKNGNVLWAHQLSMVVGDMSGKNWSIGQEWDGSTTSDFFGGRINDVSIYAVHYSLKKY